MLEEASRKVAGGCLSQGKLQVPRAPFFFCSRTTLLVQLSFEGSQGPSYLPGEHLGIFPGNQEALVQGILERVVDCPSPHQTVCLEVQDESGEPQAPRKTYPPHSYPQGLGNYVCSGGLQSQLMGETLVSTGSDASWSVSPYLRGGIREAKPGSVTITQEKVSQPET